MQSQNVFKKEKTEPPKIIPLQNEQSISRASISRVIIAIILLIVLIEVGFFKTYIQYFPKFEDATVNGETVHFNSIMHFHGIVMMGWVLMLLVQPILILKGKIKWHRRVGSLSYVLAPLVVLALYLANKDNLHYFSQHSDALSSLTVTFPSLVFFVILYSLAIFYRHRPALHMRFMCSTAFLLINPPLDRALITYLGLHGFSEGIIIVLLLAGIVTVVDSLRTKRISPFALVFGFLLLQKILYDLRDTPFWQTMGNAITKIF